MSIFNSLQIAKKQMEENHNSKTLITEIKRIIEQEIDYDMFIPVQKELASQDILFKDDYYALKAIQNIWFFIVATPHENDVFCKISFYAQPKAYCESSAHFEDLQKALYNNLLNNDSDILTKKMLSYCIETAKSSLEKPDDFNPNFVSNAFVKDETHYSVINAQTSITIADIETLLKSKNPELEGLEFIDSGRIGESFWYCCEFDMFARSSSTRIGFNATL